MLDGAARLDDLFKEAARLEMPAVAMSDHGNVYGAYDFKRQGGRSSRSSASRATTPLQGPSSAPVRLRRRLRRGHGRGRRDQHQGPPGLHPYMTMWAESTEGLHNLFRLSSLSSPRASTASRASTATCSRPTAGHHRHHRLPSGEVNRWLQVYNYDRALAAAADFQEILARTTSSAEFMDHGLASSAATARSCCGSRKLSLELPLGHQRPALRLPGRRRVARRPAVHRHANDDGRP